MLTDLAYVQTKLETMRKDRVWPNGARYLWTDAFGLVLLMSLYRHTGNPKYLEQARGLVGEVERVLGRPRGLRIGEAAHQSGQYFHALSIWMFALSVFGRTEPRSTRRGVELVQEVHTAFLEPHVGVWWKMTEDLGRNWPGYGFGVMDAFDGYVAYRSLDPQGQTLGKEIRDLKELVDGSGQDLLLTHELELGMMLWLCHMFPKEPWALVQRERSLAMLERTWVASPGYFCRQPQTPEIKYAFANYAVSLGLQAAGAHPERVELINRYFEEHPSTRGYDADPITHVMACTSRFPGFFLRPFAD
jgi:hypothetical protein